MAVQAGADLGAVSHAEGLGQQAQSVALDDQHIDVERHEVGDHDAVAFSSMFSPSVSPRTRQELRCRSVGVEDLRRRPRPSPSRGRGRRGSP